MRHPEISAIHRAVMRRSLSEVIDAIIAGDDVNSLDREGRTPLFYAVRDGECDIVEELIRHRADVNVQDKRLKSALHFAAAEYQIEAAELLLQNGAAVDAQDAHGNSPLFDAVFNSNGRGKIIELLLAWKADRSLKNRHGVSPESLANTIANYDVKQFFA